ncbi:hypothetical protein GCM10010168_53270 [Actinoplanes ianthinogenes]|uniref:Major tail protein n=1 Tax=Actinoplanes ianthinogenes TaxID=122358 RepID=A0ABN6C8F3_9ACTN|nr:hypothetical protein [Actinoplanes ianthinogenes]BCJ41675.1 hypothetical protein Aiant_23320 [Actinoplanes ianthinogenes]GGR28489.1 hypothetical protein GCM10010168_53270 [Actinoplanes ianthinogenes]
MSGDPTKASQWEGADIYIHDTIGTAGPTDLTTAWGTGWTVVGLLDGEEGATWERDEESSEKYAWGGILVKRTKSKHKRTLKFVALEDNDTVFKLINPGSTRTTTAGVTSSKIKVPKGHEFALGMELREGDKVVRRTVKRAEVDTVDEIKESESEVTVYAITVVLYPEADGTLYTEISGEVE